MHSFDPESGELTSAAYLDANGLDSDSLIMAGIGMCRTSILDLFDTLLDASMESVDLLMLRTIIAEAELDLQRIPRDQYLRESGESRG